LKSFRALKKPIGFDTDVNGPALAELIHGNHKKGTKSLCYVSVGTGAGVGLIVDGNPVHGAMHPEGGHICVKRHPNDNYKGDCEFHQDCLEGMVRISSLAARAGLEDPSDLPTLSDEHQVWDFFAYYIAQLCLSLTLTVSPDVIVLGGGVINRESLLPLIRNKFTGLLNRYVQVKTVEDVDNYIIRSKQKQNSGIIGALELSKRALLNEN
jgi:fructokinase